ncbi:DnaJ C-terminal domain-containing protein [Chloroflexota bacterium]
MGNIGDIFGSPATRSTFEDLMKDFGVSGLRVDFLDNIFGDLPKGKGFSFQVFNGSIGERHSKKGRTSRGINLEELFSISQHPLNHDSHYEIVVAEEQAAQDLERDLVHEGKKLRVKIAPGVTKGVKIRLRNARQITHNQPGDIVIKIKVK